MSTTYTIQEDNGFIHDVEPETALEKHLDWGISRQGVQLEEKDLELKRLREQVASYERELATLRPLKKEMEKRYDSFMQNKIYASLDFQEDLQSLTSIYEEKGIPKEEVLDTLKLFTEELECQKC